MQRSTRSILSLTAPYLIISAVRVPATAMAAPPDMSLIVLQNASATFSQEVYGGYPVGEAIDGDFSGISHGWAIARSDNSNNPETAVFETVDDLTAAGPITFQLHQLLIDPIAEHTLGRFRLSVTSDSRDDFADGLAMDGDVTANWTVLQSLSADSTNGVILTLLDDNSILASGPNPAIATYTLTALAPFSGITGFRLETLADPSLPFDGPGRQPTNGNFVLTEFQVFAHLVPEPTSIALAAVGAFSLTFYRRWKIT